MSVVAWLVILVVGVPLAVCRLWFAGRHNPPSYRTVVKTVVAGFCMMVAPLLFGWGSAAVYHDEFGHDSQ